MAWAVLFHDDFAVEFLDLPDPVKDELLAQAKVLETFGPVLGRPRADTLKGSKHANMKELRFSAADGAWRVAFTSTPSARLYCSLRETSPERARSGSTSN